MDHEAKKPVFKFCPGCYYLVATEMTEDARFDFDCPQCGKHKLSEFKDTESK